LIKTFLGKTDLRSRTGQFWSPVCCGFLVSGWSGFGLAWTNRERERCTSNRKEREPGKT